MAEIKVKIGKAGKQPADKSKIGKGTKPETSGDVEAQWRRWVTVACPDCWALNNVVEDSNQWLGYLCWRCDAYFEV